MGDLTRTAVEALQPFAALIRHVADASDAEVRVTMPDGTTHVLRGGDVTRAAEAHTDLLAAADGTVSSAEVATLRAEVEALRLAYALARDDHLDAAMDLFPRTEPPIVTLAVMDRAAAEGRLDDLLDLLGDRGAVPMPEIRDRVVSLLTDANGGLRAASARALQVVAPGEVRDLVTEALGREPNKFVKAILVAVLRACVIPD